MVGQVQDTAKPVYVPWKTFESYVSGLKGTVVPPKLDTSVKPPSMNGTLWRQVTSALHFLGLIDNDKKVNPRLEQLASAHGADRWASAVKNHVLPAYSDIVQGLPLENATQGQLNQCFRDNGSVDGQMLAKCVRFYVHALKESGQKFSPHFSLRKESSNGSTRKRKPSRTKAAKNKPHDKLPNENTPTGMIDFGVPFGAVDGLIRVPRNITTDQLPIFSAFVNAVEALAKQNSESED